MAGLIKNQILKHLSKFTKNLSSDKINVSTLKGEGELSNLELNEDILTNLLELPTWLRITKAVCNRVAVKIQWTKLKSQPICLYLDEVTIETETCETPRPPNNPAQSASGGKYGFVDRVMDGIFVHVNSVIVKLMSHKFHASLQLSRVKVQSSLPTWQQPPDLRATRIRDASRGEVLLFKEIEWQTTRIEATAISPDEDCLTPLRLIANQAKIRIVVKKRLSDSAIISSRLTLLLDDLLWVLTITQLKAAILYANSLKEVIERSTQQSKQLAAEKLKKQGYMDPQHPHPHLHTQQQKGAPDRQESSTAKHFARFDVASTSYHLITSRFDLHLCDDSSPADDDKRHWQINGGSMQITFYKLSIDLYPYHPAGGERKTWHRYLDNVGSRNPWVHRLFAHFREEAVKLRKICEASGMPCSSSAPSLLTSHPASPSTSPTAGTNRRRNLTPSGHVNGTTAQSQRNSIASTRSPQGSPSHQPQQGQRPTRLLESCFVVKMEDLTVYMVSMPGQKRASGHHKLLCSDKRALHLPPDMSVLHVEYTDYFFPEGLHYPVPHPNLYILVNPVRLTLDFLTLLWSNVFLLTLSQSVDMDFGEPTQPAEHVDIKLEMLMPRIIVPAEEKVEGQPDRPDAVQLQISKLVVTNTRTEERMGLEDLHTALEQYQESQLLPSKEFPMQDRQADLIPPLLYEHAQGKDNPYLDQNVRTILSSSMGFKVSNSEASIQESDKLSPQAPHHNLPQHNLCTNSLKRLASADIWSATADQVWLEFLGVQNFKNRPVPFVEAIPITLWLCHLELPKKDKGHQSRRAQIKSHQGVKTNQGHVPREENNIAPDTRRPIHAVSSSNHHSTTPSCDMPVVGSSPPISDSPLAAAQGRRQQPHVPISQHRQTSDRSNNGSVGNRHDPCGDGNSTVCHSKGGSDHRRQRRLHDDEEERRPSRLSISGSGHSSDGSGHGKLRSRSDSPCREEYSHSRRAGHYEGYPNSADPSLSHGDGGRYDSSSQRTKPVGDNEDCQGRLLDEEASLRRRRDRFHREDSRSSSSPPHGQMAERAVRSESRDSRRGKEVRKHRHSSSSSNERRDTEDYRMGGERRRDGSQSGEGGRGGERRRERADVEVPSAKDRGSYRSTEDEWGRRSGEISHRSGTMDEPGQRPRPTRQSSSSSSERISELSGRAGSRGRTRHQSGSRERRGSQLDRQIEESDVHSLDREGSHGARWAGKDEGSHRRSTRDGSRGSGERHNGERYGSGYQERDTLDGGAGYSERLTRNEGEAKAGRHVGQERRSGRGQLQRTQSTDRESVMSHQYGRSSDHSETHPRFQLTNSDYDLDRFSETSPSSVDTIGGRDGGHDLRGQTISHSPDWHSSRGHDHNQSHKTSRHKHQEPRPELSEMSKPGKCPDTSTPQDGNNSSAHLEDVKQDPEAKMCALAKITGKVRLQINHFQYLFIMRLLESVTAFQADLSADLLAITSLNATKSQRRMTSFRPNAPPLNVQLPPSPIIFVPLMLQELEVGIVCPYQMHQRTFSDDFSVLSPFLQGMTSGQDAVFGEDTETSLFPQLVDGIGGLHARDDSSLKPHPPTISFKSHSSSQLENMGVYTPPPPPPIDAMVRTARGHNSAATRSSGPVPQLSVSSVEGPKKEDSMTQSINSIGRDSGIGIDRKSTPQHRRTGGAEPRTGGGGGGSSSRPPGKSGTTDVKKAFTSAFSSFTDRLKTKMEGGLEDGVGEDLETMSIRTDTSDDDFEHLSLDDAEEVPAFFHDPPPPDVASVADSYSEPGEPGDSVSMYADSSTTKGKEMVYVLLFKVEHAEAIIDLDPEQTVTRVRLGRLSTLQLGNISYDDFQGRFSSARGYIQEECCPSPPEKAPVRCKFSALPPDKTKPDLPPDPGMLQLKVEDCSLQFKMSGVTCLSDFAEDEKLAEPLPLSLEVTNLLLVLEEDRPPANVTSPGAVPTNLHIQHMSIDRGKDGIFYLSGSPLNFPFAAATTPVPPPAAQRPETTNAVTSPILSPTGTMALLMASQNEAVLLRRQLDEVRRANRLYEHQILQWREMQDWTDHPSRTSAASHPSRVGIAMPRKRQSFTGDSQSGSPPVGVAGVGGSGGGVQPDSQSASHQPQPVDPVKEELEKENLLLQQRVSHLEDDLLTVSKEKESLLQTLQLLQDELLTSERKQRTKTK